MQLCAEWTRAYDILLAGLLKVEVKYSRPRSKVVRPGYRRQVWQFDCARLPRDEDMIIICLVDDGQQIHPYIVPSWLLLNRRSIVISSHPSQYRGLWSDCLDCWSNVAAALEHRRRLSGQIALPLFVED